MSWLVTPHVTNWIQIWLVTCPKMSKSCLKELSTLTKKSYVPKKICGMLVIETLKSNISYFLNSNTCFCSRLYGKYILFDDNSLSVCNFKLALLDKNCIFSHIFTSDKRLDCSSEASAAQKSSKRKRDKRNKR